MMAAVLFAAFTQSVFVSCSSGNKYESAESFTFDSFSEVKHLKGRTLEFDSLTMRPKALQVCDSLLITIESRSEKLLHLFNLNTMQKMGERIVRGQGPNDMLQPRFLDAEDGVLRLIDMATSRVFHYDLASFVAKATPTPLQCIRLEKQVFIGAARAGGKLMGYAYRPSHQLTVFNEADGKLEKEMIGYPVSDISYTEQEKMDAYYMNFTTDGQGRIALCYSVTDLIELYDTEGTLLKRLHGPDGFFARFKEVRKGEVITSAPDASLARDAYFSPCYADGKLFVLYDGEHVNAPDHDSNSGYILTFSWDGKPEAVYHLDDPVFTFTVDAGKRKIYGISNRPEYHIVEYDY